MVVWLTRFATEKGHQVLAADVSLPLLSPCQQVLGAPLVATLKAQLAHPLLSLHALCKQTETYQGLLPSLERSFRHSYATEKFQMKWKNQAREPSLSSTKVFFFFSCAECFHPKLKVDDVGEFSTLRRSNLFLGRYRTNSFQPGRGALL